jgi:hypothetical protein
LSYSNDTNALGMVFVKSRSATVGTNTIVQSGDQLGQLLFRGADGSNYVNSAQIRVEVDGTPGVNDMPGRIVMLVSPDGSATLAEKVRISQDGTTTLGGTSTAPALSVIPAASQTRWVTITGSNGANPTISTSAGALALGNGQLQFPASQNASSDANTLDDYEEGTWTPVLTFATPGDLSVAYSNQSGMYTKVGRVVNISLLIATSTFTHTTASGAVNVTGLPFANNASLQSYFVSDWAGITKANYTQTTFEVGASASLLTMQAFGSAQSRATISASDMPTGGGIRFRGAGAYFSA